MPVSVIHVYHEAADYLVERVRRAAPERDVIGLRTPAELAQALPAIEVLFAPTPPRDGWANAQRLRLVQLLGVGADTIMPSPDLPEHVEVASVRGVFAADVVEHVVMLMLVHRRRFTELVEQQRARRFAQAPRPTLSGERVTIVGYGAVGQRLARVCQSLDMHVRAVSRSGRDREPGVTVVPVSALATAVADAAYVVLALPLTPETRGLIGAEVLRAMRRDAYLINVARGGIVNEDALAAALTAGQLGGAALDVFAQEPLPSESSLWSVPRLTITPHVAGLGERYIERCVEALLGNVAALEAGRPRTGLIARDVGY